MSVSCYAVLDTMTGLLSKVTNKIVFCGWLNSKNERRPPMSGLGGLFYQKVFHTISHVNDRSRDPLLLWISTEELGLEGGGRAAAEEKESDGQVGSATWWQGFYRQW
jgi:hypothetical protein